MLAGHIFKDKELLLWFPKGRDGKGKEKKKNPQRDIIDISLEAILAQKGLESLLISFKLLSKAALPRSTYIPASQAQEQEWRLCYKTPSQLHATPRPPFFLTGSIVEA